MTTDAASTNPMRRRAPEEFFKEPAVQVAAAIKRGDMSTLEVLLHADPKLAATEGTGGMTMLLWAMSLQEVGGVAILLRFAADPNQMIVFGKQKFQPLALAAGGDSDDLFETLMVVGADPNSVDNGEPALFNAITARRWDRVRRLLDAGADINKPGAMNSPPVVYLAQIQEYPAVVEFIERGADLKAKDPGGSTLADYVRSFHPTGDPEVDQAHARARRMLVSRGLMAETP